MKRQFQFTERSLAACTRYTAVVCISCKAIANFGLHDLILAFWNLESLRTIACHLHLNCTHLLNSHTYFLVFSSQDPKKGLGYPTESQIWTKKVASNKTQD